GVAAALVGQRLSELDPADLDSSLIEVTADVLGHVDAATGKPFVDVVADAAEQKGTGRWTVQSALELGVPVNTIAESVFARSTSGHPDLRAAAQDTLSGPDRSSHLSVPGADVSQLVNDVRSALWASKVVAYAQ